MYVFTFSVIKCIDDTWQIILDEEKDKNLYADSL